MVGQRPQAVRGDEDGTALPSLELSRCSKLIMIRPPAVHERVRLRSLGGDVAFGQVFSRPRDGGRATAVGGRLRSVQISRRATGLDRTPPMPTIHSNCEL